MWITSSPRPIQVLTVKLLDAMTDEEAVMALSELKSSAAAQLVSQLTTGKAVSVMGRMLIKKAGEIIGEMEPGKGAAKLISTNMLSVV